MDDADEQAVPLAGAAVGKHWRKDPDYQYRVHEHVSAQTVYLNLIYLNFNPLVILLSVCMPFAMLAVSRVVQALLLDV